MQPHIKFNFDMESLLSSAMVLGMSVDAVQVAASDLSDKMYKDHFDALMMAIYSIGMEHLDADEPDPDQLA